MFACTIVLPYPKVPIKISRWDLSKFNSTKRSSKYSPIWKIYLGRLKKKILLNKSCWHHSKNIKSGLRIIWQSLQACTHSFEKNIFYTNLKCGYAYKHVLLIHVHVTDMSCTTVHVSCMYAYSWPWYLNKFDIFLYSITRRGWLFFNFNNYICKIYT